MSLTVEDGSGVAGAESYAAAAAVVAYWAARPHSAFAATVAAATTANIEGAARESSAYLDAKFGPRYRGHRAGYVQGLLFPRTGATDDAGYPLPALPVALVDATCELTARALSEALAGDLERGGAIKREQFDTVAFEYFDGAAADTSFGVVDGMMAPLLRKDLAWAWA